MPAQVTLPTDNDVSGSDDESSEDDEDQDDQGVYMQPDIDELNEMLEANDQGPIDNEEYTAFQNWCAPQGGLPLTAEEAEEVFADWRGCTDGMRFQAIQDMDGYISSNDEENVDREQVKLEPVLLPVTVCCNTYYPLHALVGSLLWPAVRRAQASRKREHAAISRGIARRLGRARVPGSSCAGLNVWSSTIALLPPLYYYYYYTTCTDHWLWLLLCSVYVVRSTYSYYVTQVGSKCLLTTNLLRVDYILLPEFQIYMYLLCTTYY